MNWAIYGWLLLFVTLFNTLRVGFQKPSDESKTKFFAHMFWLAVFMPLIGHLVGWW